MVEEVVEEVEDDAVDKLLEDAPEDVLKGAESPVGKPSAFAGANLRTMAT